MIVYESSRQKSRYRQDRTDPPGALRGPLRGASILSWRNPRASKLRARRAHCWRLRLVTTEAPRSGPRRAPGGSVQEEEARQWSATRLSTTVLLPYGRRGRHGVAASYQIFWGPVNVHMISAADAPIMKPYRGTNDTRKGVVLIAQTHQCRKGQQDKSCYEVGNKLSTMLPSSWFPVTPETALTDVDSLATSTTRRKSH